MNSLPDYHQQPPRPYLADLLTGSVLVGTLTVGAVVGWVGHAWLGGSYDAILRTQNATILGRTVRILELEQQVEGWQAQQQLCSDAHEAAQQRARICGPALGKCKTDRDYLAFLLGKCREKVSVQSVPNEPAAPSPEW